MLRNGGGFVGLELCCLFVHFLKRLLLFPTPPALLQPVTTYGGTLLYEGAKLLARCN